MGWFVYMAAVLLISGLVGLHLGRFRAAYTEMLGMMAGMTMGMLNGFLLGYAAAAAAQSMVWITPMFWGNLIGIVLGLALGAYFGRAGGLLGIMDGALGGVMGGAMGAMLVLMNRAMSIAGVTFASTVFVGLLAAPHDSADWWLDKMLSTGDSFGTVYAGNLTLRSLLAKQELTGFALDSLWITGSLLLLALAVMGIRYALSVRNVPLALVLNAVWVLLVSPISWSHHWVWAGPALALVFMMSLRNRWHGMTIAVVISAITVLAGPQWYLPNTGDRELDWTFSQQIVGNAYTLIGIGFLVCAAVAYVRFGRRPVNSPEFPNGSLIPGR